MATEIDLSSPQARRRAKTDARLREALAGLAGNPSAEPTVAALARAAGVGRNIIYTHHAGVLDGLRALQSQRAGANETTAREADRTRSALRDAEARSAALATHNARDRTSVVSGTSVSVRVDLVFRRCIKKKKNNK